MENCKDYLLPRYPNLNLIFARWGFDLLQNGREQFLMMLNQCEELEGLEFVFDLGIPFLTPESNELGYNLNPEKISFAVAQIPDKRKEDVRPFLMMELVPKFCNWISECSAIKTKFNTEIYFEWDDRFLKIVSPWINEKGFFAKAVTGKNGYGWLIVYRIKKKEGADFYTESDELEFRIINPFNSMETLLSWDNVCIERNHLKAFEQKTGFFNHGLSDEDLEKYAPTPTDEERAERQKNKRGAHLRKYVKELKDEQKNATVEAYEQAKLLPNRTTKTARLEEAASIISNLEKKKIGEKGIEKRLKNLNYSDW